MARPARSTPARAVLLPLSWVILGAWIGAMALFGGSVAPAAFRVLPSPEVAGDLVGAVLASIHVAGALAGLALAGIAWALDRGRTALVLPLVLAGLCLLNQFGVSPAVAEIRLADPQAPLDAELARRFALLHRVSVSLFGATLLGLIALFVVLLRLETRESRG